MAARQILVSMGSALSLLAVDSQASTLATVLILAVATIVAVIVAVIVFAAAAEWRRGRTQQACYLEIENTGNILSSYRLMVDEPSDELDVRFLLDGIGLEQQTVTQVVEAPAAPSRSTGREGKASPTGARPASGRSEKLQTARRNVNWVLSLGMAVASLLSTVASFLPHSVAGPLHSWANRLRQPQSTVRQIEQAPRETMSRVRQVSSQTSRRRSKGTSTTSRPSGGHSPGAVITQTWSETPPIEPGEMLTLDLLIDPLRQPRQSKHYTLTVVSHPAGQDIPPLNKTFDIHVAEIPWVQRAMPFLILAALILLEVSIVLILLT